MPEHKGDEVKHLAVIDRPLILRPTTFAELMEYAGQLAKSDLVPKEYQNKPANILVAVQYGAEIGLHAMQALQSIAVIGGKPSLYGDAGLAIVQTHPAFVSIKETDDTTTKTATCELLRQGWEPVVRQFAQADADRIQVYEGGGQRALASRTMWKNYPVRMRQMRARWWAMRDCFADALKGMLGREELEEGDEPTRPAPDNGTGGDGDDFMPRALVIVPDAVNPEAADAPPLVSAPSLAEQLDNAEQLVIPLDPTRFELNGQQFQTKGMTREQMVESLGLVGAINAKKKGRAQAVLHEEFGVATRAELTHELAAQYLDRLRAVAQES
jgi:hypothetical protein